MKKLFFLFCLELLIPYYAVSDDQVVYVYRNDGNMDAFYENELDSVRYSKLSVDSILYTNYVTQEFYTKGGVKRIPLEAIDSISTYQPETILKSDVFTIIDQRAKDVTRISGLDITFSKTASELPKVGQVLVSRADGKELDKPFIGRVKSFEYTSDGVLFHCTPAGIDDVFDQITFFGRVTADKSQSKSIHGKKVEASFDANIYKFEKEIEMDTLNGSHSQWSLKVKPHMEANFEVLIHKEWGEPMHLKFTYSYEHSETVTLSFEGESVVLDKTFNIYNKKLPRIWFAALPFVWFTPRFNVDLEVGAKGYVRAAGSMEFLDKKTHELTYTEGTWTHKETADTSLVFRLDELAIGGQLEASICPELNVGVYESEYGLGIGGSFGVRLEGGYTFDAENEDRMHLYSVLQDVQENLSFPMSTNIHARHDFNFDDDEEEGKGDDESEMENHVIKEYEYEMTGFSWYLLPTFHNVYLLDFPKENQYQASMKIERDLLMPVHVGYLLTREFESASRSNIPVTDVNPIWGGSDPEKLLDSQQVIHWFGTYWDEDDILHYGMMRKAGYNQPGKGTLHPIVRFPWMNENDYLICPTSFTTPFNGEQLYIDDGGGGWIVR